MSTLQPLIEAYGKPLLDPAVRVHFIRKAGSVYGFIFGMGYALLVWLPDAIQLQQASAYWAWAKLPIGLIVCPLIGLAAGSLAARVRSALLSVLIWIAVGIAIAWVTGHVPYEGVNLIASLSGASEANHPFYLFAAGLTGISMVVGALIGLLAGLLQLILVERAWDASTRSHRVGWRSVLALCWCLPLASVFAFAADTVINAPIRRPVVDVAWTIDRAKEPVIDLRADGVSFLYPYRNQLTSSYTLYWNGTQSDQASTEWTDIVEVVFDSGLRLRCQYGGVGGHGMVLGCSPVKTKP